MFALDRRQGSCCQNDEEEQGANAQDEVTHVFILQLSRFFLLVNSFIELSLPLVFPSRGLEFIFNSAMHHNLFLDDVGFFTIQLGHSTGAVQ